MLDSSRFSPVQEALATAQANLIVLPKSVNFDKVAAALSLFLSLKKVGKVVEIVAPQAVRVEFSSLVGIDKVRTKLSGQNLVISFDYVEDSIEKVSYNIEEEKFNLVVQPKEGFPPLSTDKVEYSYGGNQADLIFIIGAKSPNDLGQIYQQEKKLFSQAKTVSFDTSVRGVPLSQINLVIPEASSITEIVGSLLFHLKLPVDQDIAHNLLLGLEKTTRNFSSPRTTPETFEVAAFCLRAGARREAVQIPSKRSGKPKSSGPLKPMPPQVSAVTAPREEEEEIEPKEDWFTPKIYKGDTKV